MGLEKEDIKQLIAILQKGLIDTDQPVEKPTKKTKTQKTKNTNSTTKKQAPKINLFDKMSESRMHKEDVEIDKKLNKHPPTERSRSYKTVKVQCRVCGKTEQINPILIESVERYKCNKCATSAG